MSDNNLAVETPEVELVCPAPECGFYWYVPAAEYDPDDTWQHECSQCGAEGEVPA